MKRVDLPLLFCVLGVLVAAWLSVSVLGGHPHVQDEATYAFQAELLARGRLWVADPGVDLVLPFTRVHAGNLHGVFPMGWPGVLAPFSALGLGWLANPLLHGLVAWRGSRLAGSLLGEKAVLPAAALLALSPQMLLLGASWMSHTWVALLGVVGAEQCLRFRAAPRTSTALALGAVVGLAFLARPLCGVLLGLGLAAGCARVVLASPRWILVGGIPLVAMLLLQGALNGALTGSWTQFPATAFFQGLAEEKGLPATCNSLGLGPDRGCEPRFLSGGYTWREALEQTARNLEAWGRLLLGHSALLLLVGVGLFRGARRIVAAGLAFGAVVVLAYGLYWYEGTAYGARFYHLAAPAMILAAVAGLVSLPRQGWVLAALLFACGVRGAQLAPELKDYWGVDGRFWEFSQQWEGPEAVFLVDVRQDTFRPRHPVTTGHDWLEIPGLLGFSIPNRPEGRVLFLNATQENLDWARGTSRQLYGYVYEPRAEDDAWALLPPDVSLGTD